MNELALFAGAGGGILGGKLLGWRTVCAVEIEEYPRAVLLQRQNDGILDPFPIWDDVRTFDGTQWRGNVDIITGGFPCQDISTAGKGAGIDGARSGLWAEMSRIIGEVRPRFVLVENSPALTSRGLGRVLGDLATMGYNARWGVLGACDAGAPHQRERIWILGDAGMYGHTTAKKRGGTITRGDNRPAGTVETGKPTGSSPAGTNEKMVKWWDVDPADLSDARQEHDTRDSRELFKDPTERPSSTIHNKPGDQGQRRAWADFPRLGRVAHGVANRVDRLKAIGNGQVPAVVRIAWEILKTGE